MRNLLAPAVAALVLFACTVNVEHVAPAVTTDGGVDAAGPQYPAFAPEMPVVQNQKGATLSAPKLVTVTWSTDPNEAAYEAFGDHIGSSPYFAATTSEYGIAAATNTNVRVKTAAPTSWSDADLDTWVSDQVTAAPGNGWPVGDAQTVYMIYVPVGTAFTLQGSDACASTSGYHDETTTSQLAHVAYGVVLQACHDPQTPLEFSTETASHELVEAVTDPHAQSDLGWAGLDNDHYAWEIYVGKQDEVGDLCQDMDDVYYHEAAPLDYRVQRTWSNAAARAGHHPCAPAPAVPYFNATPLTLDSVTYQVGNKKTPTKGYSIPIGQTRSIPIGLYSDAPTDGWTVSVIEGDGVSQPNPRRLTIGTAPTQGNNGDTINFDVTLKSIGASQNAVLATIISQRGNESRGMPFFIVAQ